MGILSFSTTGPLICSLMLLADHRSAVSPAAQRHSPPVLCYHNIQHTANAGSPYTISESLFRQQMLLLKDSGYHTIRPRELYAYLHAGVPLPSKPVLLSFDDNRIAHFTVAARLLDSLGFTGTFFVMTVTIGKPGYMSATQLQALAARGHTIGCHTYDHPDMRKLATGAWEQQVQQPKALLEKITGGPVDYLAYPYGAWNEDVAQHVHSAGFLAAFQLRGSMSKQLPLFSIRRSMISGTVTAQQLMQEIQHLK